jgi:hypothetical protein
MAWGSKPKAASRMLSSPPIGTSRTSATTTLTAKSDILWRHDSGQVYLWEMNGLQITAEGGVSHAPVPSDWHIFSQHNFV